MSAVEDGVGGMEFRSYVDDAWYSVTVVAEQAGEVVRVKFENFGDDNDQVFPRGYFADVSGVDDFAARFRPVSEQLQDSQCSKVSTGLLVCASYQFGLNDLRFYDALVDGVSRESHRSSTSESEEECLCSFLLYWLHGENAGKITTEKLEQICRVQYRALMNSVVSAYVQKERMRFPVSKATKPVKIERKLKIGHLLSFSHHLKRESESVKWNFSDLQWSNWTFASRTEKNEHDTDIGGKGNDYMIVIENLEIDLTPLAVIEFIRREVSVSSCAFILPSMPPEISTRGAIVLDNKKKFEKLLNFLENPNQMVVSSEVGRPWVMVHAKRLNKSLQTSVKSFMLISQKFSETVNGESTTGLKVVRSGTDEFKRANQLSLLYKEFIDHQTRLQRRRVVEEGRIYTKHTAERGLGN